MDKLDKKRFDAVVIGSGPGGATVARELSQRGQKVLILERGDFNPIKGSIPQCVSTLLMPGKSLLFTNNMLGIVRGITTGGSSVSYYATAFYPPHDMLMSHGIDIREEIGEIEKELPILPTLPAIMWVTPSNWPISIMQDSSEQAPVC